MSKKLIDKETMKTIVWNPALSDQIPLEIRETTIPVPEKNEVVVNIKAASINNRDVPRHKRVARPEFPPFIPGSDGAGIIVAVGSEVSEWKAGQEVIVDPMLYDERRLLGDPGWSGTFAEFVKIPSQNLQRKPEYLSFIEAASLPMALGTAWRAVMTKAEIKSGDTVLIHGIGGGVALFCLQLAISKGAKVIVTSGSEEKLHSAFKIGADRGINYKNEDVAEAVRKYTNGRGVDVVIDPAGQQTLPISISIVKEHGRIVSFGFHTGDMTEISAEELVLKQISLMGTSMYTEEEIKEAIHYFEKYKIRPVISNVYPPEKIIDAYVTIKEKEQFGKLIVDFA